MPRQALSPLVIALVILGVLGSGVFIYYQMTKDLPSPQPLASTPDGPSFDDDGSSPPPPDIQLPPIDASDEVIRSLVEQVSEHPRLARWALNDDLVRRFVAAVDNTARGDSPRSQVPFMAPQGAFQAERQGDELVIDDASFDRYDLMTQVFLSLDTATSVRLYRQLEPLFDEAYQDLGYPGGEFDKVLQKAIQHLLKTPIPDSELEIEKAVRSYRFSDPAYENLSPAQKHYLRMGASNMRQLQAKLRLMATTLELSETDG